MAEDTRMDHVPGSADEVDRRTMLERLAGLGLVGGLFGAWGALDPGAAAAAQNATSPTNPGIALAQGMRRVITGHNAQGRSYIIQDDRVARGTFPNMYKATGDEPLGPAPKDEPKRIMATDAPQLEPVLGGSSLNFVTLPPTPAGAKPGWHRTETLDYNVVLGGELVLVVDEGETKLYPGDVVIQRNTLHAWRNDTKSPVYWVAVLVPIKRPV